MAETIVLKDRNASPLEYPDVFEIGLKTESGEIQTFYPTNAVEVPVDLDFSGDTEYVDSDGNIVVTGDGGALMSRVLIRRPADLVSSNIREGKTIAGIPGAMSSDGGGERGYQHAYTGNYFSYTASGFLTRTITTTIPADAKNIVVLFGYAFNQGSNSNYQVATPVTSLTEISDYTTTVVSDSLQISKSYSFYKIGLYYAGYGMELFIMYTI